MPGGKESYASPLTERLISQLCYNANDQGRKRIRMGINPENKRRFPRIVTQAPLRYQITGTPEFGNSTCNNLSAGGLAFVNERFIPLKTQLKLQINILSRTLSPTALVRWINPIPHSYRYHMGLEFSDISLEEKNYLKDYIDIQKNST